MEGLSPQNSELLGVMGKTRSSRHDYIVVFGDVYVLASCVAMNKADKRDSGPLAAQHLASAVVISRLCEYALACTLWFGGVIIRCSRIGEGT